MSRKASCKIAALALFALGSSATAVSQQETAHELLLEATERLQWQNYWLPNTVDKSYVPGKEVRVLVRFSSSAAGFCAPVLGFCEIYEKRPNGELQFLTEWAANGQSYDSAQRFLDEYSRARENIALALPSAKGGQPRHTFDVTKMAEPHPTEQIPSQSFESSLLLNWKLTPLGTPRSISRQIRPADVRALRAEVIGIAKQFRSSQCGSRGQGTIPYYSTDDPRVFAYIDLGANCEKGVFEFMRRPEGGWIFSRFVVDPPDLNLLTPRIRKAEMETFTLVG
jgi:hypothetical protein